MRQVYNVKNSILKLIICIISAGLASCTGGKNTLPEDTFDKTLDIHLKAINSRNLGELTPTVNDSVVMIGPDGDVLRSKMNFADFHKTWFSQPNWDWTYQILRKESTDSLGYAFIQYTFTQHDSTGAVQFTDEDYLVLIFKNSKEGWQLVHDQNTRIKK